MRRNYILIILSMLFSLFIYLFYRTERTVINEIFISIISSERYTYLKTSIIDAFPFHDLVIYSLPEGLWVFCITLTSKYFYIKVNGREISLLFLPLLFSIGLEFFQLLRLTNGRFDLWDILVSIVFWITGYYLPESETLRENIFKTFTLKGVICILSYMVVYLAHVWK